MRVRDRFSQPVGVTARGAAQDGEGTERGTRRWSGGCQEDPSRPRDRHQPEEFAHGLREHAACYAGRCQCCRQNDTRLSSPGTIEIPRSNDRHVYAYVMYVQLLDHRLT